MDEPRPTQEESNRSLGIRRSPDTNAPRTQLHSAGDLAYCLIRGIGFKQQNDCSVTLGRVTRHTALGRPTGHALN